MSNLIDRIMLLEEMEKAFFETDPTGEEQLGFLKCTRLTREAPVVDAVICCADCAYYGKSPLGHPTFGWCRIDAKHRSPKFYCANADRK